MSTKDLRAKYGGNSRQAMARAIRAEIPGGSELLAAEGRTFVRCTGATPPGDRLWHTHHSARVDAENEIRRRYDIPLRHDRINLPPSRLSTSELSGNNHHTLTPTDGPASTLRT